MEVAHSRNGGEPSARAERLLPGMQAFRFSVDWGGHRGGPHWGEDFGFIDFGRGEIYNSHSNENYTLRAVPRTARRQT